jgi:hypothetical protein
MKSFLLFHLFSLWRRIYRLQALILDSMRKSNSSYDQFSYAIQDVFLLAWVFCHWK